MINPVLCLLTPVQVARFHEALIAQNAGIVDYDVDASKRRQCCLDDFLAFLDRVCHQQHDK